MNEVTSMYVARKRVRASRPRGRRRLVPRLYVICVALLRYFQMGILMMSAMDMLTDHWTP